MQKHGYKFWIAIFSLICALAGLTATLAQQPQTPPSGTPAQAAPIYAANAKYVQGVGPGYWSTCNAATCNTLVLAIAAGTVNCANTIRTYAGGTLTLANNTTNYVYLDTTSLCAPASNTTGFTGTTIPIATVVTSSGSITSITDNRVFMANGTNCSNCVVNNAVNTGTAAMTLDLSASTVSNAFKVPVGAAATATANGAIDYDSTNNNYHAGAASADSILPTLTATPANNDCVKWTVSSGRYKLDTAGGACSTGGGSIASATTNQIAHYSGSTSISGIDFPDVKQIPAANCNNTTAGNAWSIGSGGSVLCRGGTNNLGGYILITDTSTTFATFQVVIPEDWDSATNPYIRFQLASTDATNGHTVIPEINVACYKGDGSTTDDVAANGFHSLSTVTLNGNANRFWSTSNVQLNSTDMTGCVAGALMQITVGRATDTATNAEFYSATMTFPRLPVVQAN